VFPFSVDSVAVGYGSATAAEETTDGSRAELWLPLWEAPATLAEAKHLFAEGRAQFGRLQAKNAIEFALAINLLGVSRGVSGFARYGFLKRNGLAFLATPLGRVSVTPRPKARLLADPPLRTWLDRLRRACSDKEKTPARYQAALRGIDRAMFRFANRSEAKDGEAADRRELVQILAALGRAERTLAGGVRFCEDKYLGPIAGLRGAWLDQADDGSVEFRLAAALAGIRGHKKVIGPLRVFVEPVAVRGRGFKWDGESTSAVWSNRPLEANLAAVFRRRQLEAFRAELVGVPLRSRRPASLSDVLSFLRRETNDDLITDLVWALATIEWSSVEKPQARPVNSGCVLPFEFGVPRLLVEEFSTKNRDTLLSGVMNPESRSTDPKLLKPDPAVLESLYSNRPDAIEQCVTRAARRLKTSGLIVNGYRNRQRSGKPLEVSTAIEPRRLLAAMLFPLRTSALKAIADTVLYPSESKD